MRIDQRPAIFSLILPVLGARALAEAAQVLYCELGSVWGCRMNEANKEQADKCREVAEAALRAGDTAKAERFALKAQRLFPNDEVNGIGLLDQY
jgi:hypothetical protein